MSLGDVSLNLVESLEDCGRLLTWLGSRDAESIAVDTETTGLVRGKDFVRLVQVGGMTHGWAIPWEQWNGVFRDLLARYRGRWLLHNSLFDVDMLDAADARLPVDRVDDTWVGASVLEGHLSGALKPQAARHVDQLAAGAQAQLDLAIRKGGWSWATVPVDFAPYWQYGALDTVLTRHLWEYQRPLIQATCPAAYDLELAILWVIRKMTRYGAHIDVPYAREKIAAFDDYVEQAADWIWDHYHVKAGSNQAIIELLQAEGYQFTKQTDGGALSLDKDVLGPIDHPLAQTVLQRRQLQKLSSTYLRHFIEEVDANDCIHPNINPLGARTSRMTITDPGLQTLPRKSERNRAAETVRNCVSTRYDGGSLLMCDFGQIEMRLLAHVSGDRGLQEAFRQPADFFVTLARQMFNDPDLVKADPRRQFIKNTGYAKIYGAGIPKLAATARVPEEQARLVMARFDTLFPGVRAYQDLVDRLGWQRQKQEGAGYVTSPLTGRRFYADRNKIYPLVNYQIQGTGAELLKMKILELDAVGLGEFMVVPVHDEVVLDLPGERVADAIDSLRDIMNDERLLDVPVTAEVSQGQRWGAKVEVTTH